MAVLVKDVMLKNVVTISDEATLGQAIKVFADKQIGSLPMVDKDGHLTAYLSDGDVVYYVISTLRLLRTESKNYRYRYPENEDFFTPLLKNCVCDRAYDAATHRVITAEPDETVRHAAEIMAKKNLKAMPVVENGKVVGLLNRNEIVQGLFKNYLKDPEAECVEIDETDF